MLIASLLFFGLAIAGAYLTRNIANDVAKVLSGLAALICLITGLFFASWLLKLIMLLLLLVLPTCFRGARADHRLPCPRGCIARGRCVAPKSKSSHCLGWVRPGKARTKLLRRQAAKLQADSQVSQVPQVSQVSHSHIEEAP
jgi:hypothetical protein